jgi:type VI secretion system protein ImpF
MARTQLERTVLPSLLDRLTDLEPSLAGDAATSHEASVRAFRRSVQRDVETLLNARRSTDDAQTAPFPEVARSVLVFGLPDTSALAISTEDGREQLLAWLEETLALFEPRLADVRVRLVDADQGSAPQVRFTVEALLRMDPSPEQVVFDTVLELATGAYGVTGAGPAAAR